MATARAPNLRQLLCKKCYEKTLSSYQGSIRVRGYATRIEKPEKPEIYDVVTVGGGPVGLALVAALKSSPATRNLKIALIEAQSLSRVLDWTPSPDTYSNRASSLTPSSVSFISSIGAWRHIENPRVQVYNAMQVWDGSNDASISFDWGPESDGRSYDAVRPTIATMIENANLSRALVSRILEVDQALGGKVDATEDLRSSSSSNPSLMFNSTVSSIENGHNDPDGLDLSSWPVVTIHSQSQPSPSEPSAPPQTRSIAARLLIGADGVNSPVRTYAGISSNGWDYDRHGVVGTLNIANLEILPSSSSHRAGETVTAYQRFLPALGGPIALLPLPNGKASLVWSTTPKYAAYLKSLPPQTLVTMVNAAFRLREVDLEYLFTLPPSPSPSPSPSSSTPSPSSSFLDPSKPEPEVETHSSALTWRLTHTPPPPSSPSLLPPAISSLQPGTLASFPLRFRQSSTYTSPRVALVGDAAHTIHPLAGQGLNLGLGDAEALSRVLSEAVRVGGDLGDESAVLTKYAAGRWGRALAVGGSCDALGRVYGDSTWGVVGGLARLVGGVGMGVLDGWGGGKRWVMKQAGG